MAMKRICGDLAKAWRKERKCVCGVEEELLSVRICFLRPEVIMGHFVLDAEHLNQAVLKFHPWFISPRVSPAFYWSKALCHCSKCRRFFSGSGGCHSGMSCHIFCDHMLLTVMRL